jgi:hypothetical protein
MLKRWMKRYKRFLRILSFPIILSEYFSKDTGKEYGIGFLIKLRLAFKVIKNKRRIKGSTHYYEHLTMITRILKVPRSVEGCVVECGSYKGRSTASLSLACSLCGRRLEVFDSFEGLPEPSAHDKSHVVVDVNEIQTYSKGGFRGTLDEVKTNVSKYGEISVCNFNVGYFDKTLPGFNKKCVFVFLDVDLKDSLETCLIYLWPNLQDNCYLFTHEAHHMDIASLFFDRDWWNIHFNSAPPGLVGAGCGIGLVPVISKFGSSIGYSVKNPRTQDYEVEPQEE